MSGLHSIDVAVLVLYLVGITGLGLWMARRVKNVGDFFMPRRFGKVMMITHAFGTGTASDQAVTVAAETFRSGLSGIWWQWLWLPATPFYWLIAPIMRRFRAVTTADVYALRYNTSVAVLFAVVGVVGLSVKIGLMLKGSSALVDSCTAGLVSANWAIAIITLLFVIYGTAGGLGAAIVTDFVQGILTVVFSFLLLPFVLAEVGGLAGIRATVEDPKMLSLVVPGEIGVFFVIMYAIQGLVGIVAQPFIMGVCAAGRTEMDGRVGFMVGNIIKRICTIAWSLTALGAVAWYQNRGVDLSTVTPDHVYGDVARAFLPVVMPGLLGVFLASLLASVMSSCDSFMIASSGLFTENIYRPLVPDKSQRHYVSVGRVAALVVVVGGICFAYWVPDVVTALKIWFKIAPMMGVAFWLGLFWRRATAAGAWAATLTGFAIWWLTSQAAVIALVARLPGSEWFGFIWQPAGGGAAAIKEPWVIVFYTLAAAGAGVVVSLVTRPVAEQKLDLFYALTRTPITAGEVITESCVLPEGVTARQRRMLLTAFGLEVPAPSVTSVVGFLAGWVAVAALIGGFVWFVAS
ncbi:MAG: sodium/proline symporter PutP [Planctomycetia bacterium]|nr:MAG: sodium/proline symporter PutP [Planctomycetia bacterium]